MPAALPRRLFLVWLGLLAAVLVSACDSSTPPVSSSPEAPSSSSSIPAPAVSSTSAPDPLIPDLVGLPLEEALDLLSELGVSRGEVVVSFRETGVPVDTVAGQVPSPGSVLGWGRAGLLVHSPFRMPELSGSDAAALAELESWLEARQVPLRVEYVFDPSVSELEVLSSVPEAGGLVSRGSEVVVWAAVPHVSTPLLEVSRLRPVPEVFPFEASGGVADCVSGGSVSSRMGVPVVLGPGVECPSVPGGVAFVARLSSFGLPRLWSPSGDVLEVFEYSEFPLEGVEALVLGVFEQRDGSVPRLVSASAWVVPDGFDVFSVYVDVSAGSTRFISPSLLGVPPVD